MSIKVTREQMLQIMPTAKERVDKYLTYINSYAEVFEIDTQLRMAHRCRLQEAYYKCL